MNASVDVDHELRQSAQRLAARIKTNEDVLRRLSARLGSDNDLINELRIEVALDKNMLDLIGGQHGRR